MVVTIDGVEVRVALQQNLKDGWSAFVALGPYGTPVLDGENPDELMALVRDALPDIVAAHKRYGRVRA